MRSIVLDVKNTSNIMESKETDIPVVCVYKPWKGYRELDGETINNIGYADDIDYSREYQRSSICLEPSN